MCKKIINLTFELIIKNMSVFDNSLDSISILFIILHSFHFIVSIFVVIFMIFRIIAEFNDPFINKLKLIQNSTILI